MSLRLPSFLRYVAIFNAGFVIAWVIRTPEDSNAHRHSENTALPEKRIRTTEPTAPRSAIPKSSAISKGSRESEEMMKKLNDGLLDSQVRLAKAKEEFFKSNADLSYAYEAWRTYKGWQQNMASMTGEARGWWDDQQDPAVRSAMREITRKLLVQELAVRINDPASRQWIAAWAGTTNSTSEQGIQGRQQWWSDGFVPLPDFHTLPPPDVLLSLLDPTSLPAVLEKFRITEDERSCIKPSIYFYLEASAQAGVIAKGGESYYDQKKGPDMASLEREVEIKNRDAVDFSKSAADPK